MKFTYYLIAILITLSSCEDNIDINKSKYNNQLVIYCFPTLSDTTKIFTSRTHHLNNTANSIGNMFIRCKINNKEKNVYLLKEENNKTPAERVYYFTHKQQVGDIITLDITTQNKENSYTQTTIPAIPKIKDIVISRKYKSGKEYNQIKLTLNNFTNRSYYAIRIIGKEIDYNNTVYEKTESIECHDEPVLNNYSIGESYFNTPNDFYHNFYIFDNSYFSKDSLYTLHLNLPINKSVKAYKVQLYHITPDFYQFFKSINDINNNKLGEYGISFINTTYTNINNGLGIMGGYSRTESKWLK